MLSNFSRKEKLMIIVLAILLIGLLYYRFIHISVNERITSAKNDAQVLQQELDLANARLKKAQGMESKMGPGMSKMGSYNSSKAETAFLNTVLANVPSYTVSFDEVTRDKNQIRRNFQLRFTTDSYDSAVNIIKNLTEGEYRCLIGDVRCSIADGGQTTMDVSGTFYETMVGGMKDSALPADSSETEGTAEDY